MQFNFIDDEKFAFIKTKSRFDFLNDARVLKNFAFIQKAKQHTCNIPWWYAVFISIRSLDIE